MIGEAGYDPFASARFLQSMETYTDFRSVSGATDASLDFLASHPATPQRIQLALGHARRIGAPGLAPQIAIPSSTGSMGFFMATRPTKAMFASKPSFIQNWV